MKKIEELPFEKQAELEALRKEVIELRQRLTLLTNLKEERKYYQEELRKNRELYLPIIQNFPNGSIYVFDHDLRYILAEGEGLTKAGFSGKEIKGKTLYEVLPNNNLEKYYRAALAGNTVTFESSYKGITTLVRALPLKNARGDVFAGMMVTQTITEQKRTEEQLRLSQDRFAKIFQVTPLSIAISRISDGCYLDVNDAFLELTGYCREEVVGHSALEEIWINTEERLRFIEALANQGQVRAMEVRMGGKNGRNDPGLLSAEIIELDGEKCVLSTFLRINERKQAEEALAAEKERLSVTLQSIADAVITTDTEGKIILMNPAAEELTGWKQNLAQGQPLEQVLRPVKEKTKQPIENPVARVLESGALYELPHNIRLVSHETRRVRNIVGSAAPISSPALPGQVVGVVLVFRDVTEKVKMEQELLKAQKLESVGLLAGGIAHDFNNILTAALGYISMARMESESTGKEHPGLYELLTEAETSIFRARNLTQQLLTFAKGGAPVRKVSALPPLLQEEVRFVLHGSNVRADFLLPSDLWMVDIDEGQITQVVHNLVINAVQAMPNGGKITIEAENINVRYQRPPDLPLALKDDVDYVKLNIRDEGKGIRPEFLPKIFDPYFTTKPRGNGLGLATCFSILRQHDGFITVQSKQGEGTMFSLYLPVPNKEAETTFKVKQLSAVQNQFQGNRERLLIVDDEKSILIMLKRVLENSGYRVELAQEAQQALNQFQQALIEKDPYKLVIVDLTLPGGIGGKELMEQLLIIDPQVRAIVASGYSTDPVVAQYSRYGFAGAISKPFLIEELRQKISELLPHQKELIPALE